MKHKTIIDQHMNLFTFILLRTICLTLSKLPLQQCQCKLSGNSGCCTIIPMIKQLIEQWHKILISSKQGDSYRTTNFSPRLPHFRRYTLPFRKSLGRSCAVTTLCAACCWIAICSCIACPSSCQSQKIGLRDKTK